MKKKYSYTFLFVNFLYLLVLGFLNGPACLQEVGVNQDMLIKELHDVLDGPPALQEGELDPVYLPENRKQFCDTNFNSDDCNLECNLECKRILISGEFQPEAVEFCIDSLKDSLRANKRQHDDNRLMALICLDTVKNKNFDLLLLNGCHYSTDGFNLKCVEIISDKIEEDYSKEDFLKCPDYAERWDLVEKAYNYCLEELFVK